MMAEELTRKLLKVFGVAVTDFEDRCQEIGQQAREAMSLGDAAAFVPLLEGLVRSTSDVTRRLLEVTHFVVEQQNRTSAELLSILDQVKKQKGLST